MLAGANFYEYAAVALVLTLLLLAAGLGGEDDRVGKRDYAPPGGVHITLH